MSVISRFEDAEDDLDGESERTAWYSTTRAYDDRESGKGHETMAWMTAVVPICHTVQYALIWRSDTDFANPYRKRPST